MGSFGYEIFRLDDRPLGHASLGATTFCATAYSSDTCGSNGLPLTPLSVQMLGKFQAFRQLRHENLCAYIELIRGKHERVYLISEHYAWNAFDQFELLVSWSIPIRTSFMLGIASGIKYLHSNRIAHRNLSLGNVLINRYGKPMLTSYEVWDITLAGTTVPFPIG
ncbi:unnamed protein product [Cyprideis torosa]|uniref:Uncharacterized protein n=1 Tax=Cyprideis torosa TaxID=163714 RepID=A0A7R8ZL89_9CRUS|nr:unnamed protein product [Cyprideis torosa]CAG0883099.1 unnamed protein product [Cyprideis torosa]